jgi:hypothetical protein
VDTGAGVVGDGVPAKSEDVCDVAGGVAGCAEPALRVDALVVGGGESLDMAARNLFFFLESDMMPLQCIVVTLRKNLEPNLRII